MEHNTQQQSSTHVCSAAKIKARIDKIGEGEELYEMGQTINSMQEQTLETRPVAENNKSMIPLLYTGGRTQRTVKPKKHASHCPCTRPLLASSAPSFQVEYPSTSGSQMASASLQTTAVGYSSLQAKRKAGTVVQGYGKSGSFGEWIPIGGCGVRKCGATCMGDKWRLG